MRSLILRFTFYAGLMILGAGLFRTQILEGGRYRTLSEKNRVRLIPLEAPRGRVFDRTGKLLATNRASYDLVATPEDVTPEVFPMLAKLLEIPEREVRRRMSAPREYPFAPAVIQEDISREMVFKIEERRPELPGVFIQVAFLRYYPYHETASHLIGFIGKISEQEYKASERRRYGMNSLMGRAGIEKIYDERLRGWRGGRQIEVNARGDLVRVLSSSAPEPGEDLHLTIDLELQNKVMDKIAGKHASAALMDIESGEFIVLASSPAFDPNVFVTPGRARERMAFLNSPESPLLDRGVGSAYPPGSVFKLVTALAALELGKITPHTHFNCNAVYRLKPGARPFHCWYKRGHGSLDLYQALERSCNVYFYNLGARLSADQIAAYARRLGLGEPMPMEATNVTTGLVPDTAWKMQRYGQDWYQGETLSFAIGQSYLLVSPVQILRLSAIIAKNGERVRPRLLAADSKAGEAAEDRDQPVIHPENLKVIRRGMLNVVESDFGTGQFARLDFGKLAAKTGTAQVPPKDPHSWITGFFPYENPKVAFVVFVEHGGSGGITAAKIAKEMFQLWGNNAPKVA